MSNKYYNEQWKEVLNDLEENIQIEQYPKEQWIEKGLPTKGPDYELFMFQHFAPLYIRYIKCYKRLEDCYDQLVHPQKRFLLKEMLENTMVRMCEIKHELVRYFTHTDQVRCDFVNLDDIMMNLKLTPDYLEIPFPRYFKDYDNERERRNKLVEQLLLKHNGNLNPEIEVFEERTGLSSDEEEGPPDAGELKQFIDKDLAAICRIQANERGRQGIEQVTQAKYTAIANKKKEQKKKMQAQGGEFQEQNERELATLTINKYFRGYKAREQVDKLRQEELLFLGMKKVRNQNLLEEEKKYQEKRDKTKLIQRDNLEELVNGQQELYDLVKHNDGPDMTEQMKIDRREWILQGYLKGKLPDKVNEYYVWKEQQLAKPLSPEEEEKLKAEEEAKAKQKKAKKDAKKAGKGKKGAKKSEQDEFLDSRRLAGQSEITNEIQTKIQQFSDVWAQKDDTKNFEQKYDSEIAKKKIRPEVEKEIEAEVDELIQTELDNLRFEEGLKKKGKKKKKKKKRKKMGKKKKVPGAAGVKDKDPEHMLDYLVECQVVKRLAPAKISDLIGEHNNKGIIQDTELNPDNKNQPKKPDDMNKYEKQRFLEKQMELELMPDPSMAQIRALITEYIAIPLGSDYAKAKLEKMSNFLFYGPVGSGKTFMVRALANECDALLFDISASKMDEIGTSAGPDNKGAPLQTLYRVFMCAKKYQPAIIYIDEIEQFFPAAKSKKKKGATAAPPSSKICAKLKKPLNDYKKIKFFQNKDDDGVEKWDRVVIIGCTNKPQAASMKDLKSFFDKKFYFPYPDYATMKLLFKTFVEKKGIDLPNNFPLSTIAEVSKGFSAGSLQRAVDKVITENRKKHIQERPLRLAEFVSPLAFTHYTFNDEYSEFRKFTDTVTGLGERREKKKNPEGDDDKNKKGKGGKKGKK